MGLHTIVCFNMKQLMYCIRPESSYLPLYPTWRHFLYCLSFGSTL